MVKEMTMGLVTWLLLLNTAVGQVANPAPGCSATPARIETNKKVAMEFFRPGISGADRVALADPTYVQHNPTFKKVATEAGLSDYEYFKSRFGAPAAAGQTPSVTPTPPSSLQPPQGNALEIVTAECDLVTVIHKSYQQDPTAGSGTFYEAFTFDVFRVRGGKLVEHWDGATISPPSPNPGR